MTGKRSGKLDQQVFRTDLALEEKERVTEEKSRLSGVAVEEWEKEALGMKFTRVQVLNERGAKALGKEQGNYLTLEIPGLEKRSDVSLEEIKGELGRWIRELAEHEGRVQSVLVAGLGNLYVTPDSLGPRVLEHLTVTRQVELGKRAESGGKRDLSEPEWNGERRWISGIVPGVMAQTGMETAEILTGIVKETKPDLMIAIDALAARSIHRLGCTLQLSDTGIRPGSGVGNHRRGLNRESLGIPVLAVGVPTVVGAAAIVMDTMGAMIQAFLQKNGTKRLGAYLDQLSREEQYALIRELLEPEIGPMYVTPPDIGERIEQLGRLIAGAIGQAFG